MNDVCESRLRRRFVSDGWRNGRRITAVSVPEARVYFSGSCGWDTFDVYLSRRSDGWDRMSSNDFANSGSIPTEATAAVARPSLTGPTALYAAVYAAHYESRWYNNENKCSRRSAQVIRTHTSGND